MGNICGKAESDHFSSPGRAVGAAPRPGPQSAPVPKRAKVGGPGRTLGGGGPESQSETGGGAPPDEARRRAAEAAEARAASNKPGGKLQSQLTAQKKQTRSETLKDASRQELQSREADDATRARNWE